MRRHPLTLAIAILCGFSTPQAFSLTTGEITAMMRAAETWRAGQPVPAALRSFRDPEGCLPSPEATVPVFGNLTNYALLQRLISLEDLDLRVFDCAVARALDLVGPGRFFGDLEKLYAQRPAFLEQPRHRHLRARLHTPHVVVDGLFIDDADMEPAAARAVFGDVARDLEGGTAFAEAQKKYWAAHEYAYTERLGDGREVQLRRTRVGNYGDFIVSKDKADALPFRHVSLPRTHVAPLLAAGKAGQVIVLRDEVEKRLVLYQVREVYLAHHHAMNP